MAHLSVRDLKTHLTSSGVDISSCVEKGDLVHLFEQHAPPQHAQPQYLQPEQNVQPNYHWQPQYVQPPVKVEPSQDQQQRVQQQMMPSLGQQQQMRQQVMQQMNQQQHTLAVAPSDDHTTLAAAPTASQPPRRSRQFWHAGEYKSHSASAAPGSAATDELDRARVHPKFLHSNATSHKWALGAIAELLDNSVDEIPNGCTFVALDIESDGDGGHLLSVLDDGGGMDRARLHNMLSFGMSNGTSTCRIGQYGNGFKTSSMRLGGDALVLTTCRSSGERAAGLLSYTMLRATAAEDVVTPLVSWDAHGQLQAAESAATQRSLPLILQWSPYHSEAALLRAFERLGAHGTLVLISNLWESESGQPELDWLADARDVRLRPAEVPAATASRRKGGTLEQQQAVRDKYYGWQLSLRKYAAVLYRQLPSGFELRLRGARVEAWDVAAELKHAQVERYQPHLPAHTGGPRLAGVYPITLGFVTEAPDAAVMGFLVYHRNRLIKCMWEPYTSPSSTGRGVIGVLEVDFVQPAHDKQDFERTDLFARLEAKLKQLQPAFWRREAAKVGYAVYGSAAKQSEAAAAKEGLVLERSETSSTGFADVYVERPSPNGRAAKRALYEARTPADDGTLDSAKVLGIFDTAEEAALAVARVKQAARRCPPLLWQPASESQQAGAAKRRRVAQPAVGRARGQAGSTAVGSEGEDNREVIEVVAEADSEAEMPEVAVQVVEVLPPDESDGRNEALQARVLELEQRLLEQEAELTSLRAYKASSTELLERLGCNADVAADIDAAVAAAKGTLPASEVEVEFVD